MSDNIKSSGDCQQAEATGVIYKITNMLNGKSYVGQTRRSLEARMYRHKYDSNKAKCGIDAAIAKYGWENFTVEVLETCPVSKLNEREIFFIAALNTKAPNGYNLTDGGDGNPNPSEETRAKISAGNIGKKYTPETKAKIAAAHQGKPSPQKGRKRSPETCKRISDACKGKPSPRKGKSHSPEAKAKMSAAQKAAWTRRKKALETRGDS